MLSFLSGKKVILGIKILVAFLIVCFLIYYFRFSPVKVQAYKVENGTVVSEVMGTGTLEAKVRASISSKISGLLIEVLTDQGERVIKGQLIARLDDKDLQQQVKVAEAELSAAKATVNRVGAEIESAQATVVKEESNYKRSLTLSKTHAVAQKELETALESMNVARSKLNQSELARIEAQKGVEKAEASLSFNKEILDDTNISAPFDALVVRRNRDPGDVVVPGSSIVDIISTDQLWISAWVDETAMGLLAVGQPAVIIFRSRPEAPVKGKVIRFSPETDRETREFLVDVGMEQLPKIWAVGQRAEVYIETAQKNDVLIIPQKFIVWRDKQPFVMVDADGKARWQKIAIGMRGVENVEVTDGLKQGQIVIGAEPGGVLPREGRAVKHDKL